MENIKENNSKIAGFMGLDYSPKELEIVANTILEYHTSYDWLMAVLEKIKNTKSIVIYGAYREAEGENVDIILHNLSISLHYCTLKIEYGRRFKTITRYYDKDGGMLNSVYCMVIDFINWYNNQK